MKNTTLCHIENNGRFLMLHRIKKKNDLNHDKWVGIGGKLEEGESPEEGNRREVYEETGLQLTSARYRGIVTFVSDQWEGEYMHLFTSDRFTGTLHECDEGILCWVNKKDLPTLPMWEGDQIFLRLMERPDQPFFSLKLIYQGDRLTDAVLDGVKLDISATIRRYI